MTEYLGSVTFWREYVFARGDTAYDWMGYCYGAKRWDSLQAITDIIEGHVNVHLPTDYVVRLWREHGSTTACLYC